MEFESQLKKLLRKSISNQFTGNDKAWPDFIYDDYKDPKLPEILNVKLKTSKNKIKSLLQKDEDKNKLINDCLKRFDIKGLSKTYDLLNDSHSKKLLVRIIAFRMLGPSKVKMPLTSRKAWDPYFEIRRLKQNKEVTSKYYKFNLFNLKKIGYKIKLYYDDFSIFINFVLKQYEYARGNYLCSAVAGDYVIDGGACFGDTALFFANEVGPNGKVFSFEFVPDNLKLVRTNLNLNPSLKKRVVLVKNPLWSNSKENLYVVEYGPASTVTMKKPAKYDYKVATKSIDDYVKAEKIKKIDFIKMDIEGAELESVRGAKETIRKFKPKLAICLYHDIDHFVSIPKLVHELLPDYDLRINHYTIHLGETVMYGVPKTT